ncbi:helix-turn-helix domain-containing protein [Providencia sp. PROV197]|uniref:helix-turn-helix domain-containing protein n=1 Tax=Providencia sp. PROV197 TaxID=2949898 RepID=UPI00234BA467|nr:helix-turn-helix transcriptional regulator [Providencia sp. PROV197]
MSQYNIAMNKNNTILISVKGKKIHFNEQNEFTLNKMIGRYIQRKRRNYGLTGNELARLIGVSQQQISRYEGGVTNITLPRLLVIINKLNVDIETFIIEFISIIEQFYEVTNQR